MSIDNRRNFIDILSLDPNIPEQYEIIKKEYRAVDIETVKIDGNPFTNYGVYQFVWEKTYVKEPDRSGSGVIGNLNSYATFLTPHLIMNFSIMSIDDYRKIMQLHYQRNEFTVECYDPIYNKTVKVKMYFATEQMAKLHTIQRKRFTGTEWEEWLDLVGVREYSVEMIGTNNDLDLVSFGYVYNSPIALDTPIPNEYEEDVYFGEEIIVGQNARFIDTPPKGYKFKEWNTQADGKGLSYYNGVIITVNQTTELYAIWELTVNFTLSFNYGIAEPVKEIDSTTGIETPIYNRTVQSGKSIGNLPIPSAPRIKDKETYYTPFKDGAWYKIPIKDSQEIVNDNDLYWDTRDDIIYLLYDKKEYDVEYVTNSEYVLPKQQVKYDETVFAPTLGREGYTFKGWYLDEKFVEAFTGKMRPYKITLYAKWEKNK